MIFGPTPVGDAAGAILVHSVAAGKARFKKGRSLSADDIAALEAAGVVEVTTVRLEANDIAEDEAATRIAAACQGANVRRQAAFTGRCNLYAESAGVVVIDRDRIDRLNRIDEAVTVATLVPFDTVETGQMLATVKVIPFAAPATAVEAAEALAGSEPIIRVAAFAARRAGLIMTQLPGSKASVLDKTRNVLEDRLTRCGSQLIDEVRCRHDASEIAAAIGQQLTGGCNPILIFGASAITDRRDEIPAGIEAAGGSVEHFGMPVDPGNLLLLGRHGDVPVIGLPGCARSPKLNGFDWVMERLLADLPVTAGDIQGMGVGGLLKEIPSRPQPRGAEDVTSAPRAPRIAAVVLAAGQSRRMGRANKLLMEVDGQAMLARVVDAALASQATSVTVVTGHEADQVSTLLAGRKVGTVHNPDFASGLASSLKAGIAALPADTDGAVILLGDMPRLTPAHIDRLIAAFNPVEGRAICVPTYRGKRGNPVLFARSLFAEIAQVGGDVGARHLIGGHEDLLAEVAMDDDAIFIDVDTPDALTAIRAG